MRESILKGLHDEVGHWEFNSTYSFVRNHFWWPNMRQEVASFVKSCDTCQKTKPYNPKESAGKILISGLFHTWCIDFAGPLLRTNMSKQYLILAAEQMSKWSVAWAIPADLLNSLGVMEFVKKEIIMLFGPPQYILWCPSTGGNLVGWCAAILLETVPLLATSALPMGFRN